MMNSGLMERVLAQVSEQGIIEMSKDVISICTPTGHEEPMADYMKQTFEEMGLRVSWQQVEEGRANVIGVLEGIALGKSLMFNGHMDTSYTGQEAHLTGIGYKPFPVIKDGVIYGLGIYNMKGALVCYTSALKAVMVAGVKLEGDVIIAAVAGEIEKSQWGTDFVGAEYRGYGAGTHYMVNHGFIPDMCILGEPTDMKIVLGHFGSMWVRISTHGPYMHTGFSSGRQNENAIHRMRRVMDGIAEWIPSWEEKAAYGGKNGIVNLGCVQGGHPWRVSRLPDRCDVFLDVRVPPTFHMADAARDIKELVLGLRRRYPDHEVEYEIFVTAPGAEIEADHPLVKAIVRSHKAVIGEPPETDTVIWSSDASVMTRYGIETINYGPSSGVRKADGEKVPIQVMTDITKVYARVICDICVVTQ